MKDQKGSASGGMLYLMVFLGMLAMVSMFAIGGFSVPRFTNPPPSSSYTCCDSGDGSACRPLSEKQITFNGEAYGLLKSHVFQNEGRHLDPASPDQYVNPSAREGRIFLNSTDHNHEAVTIAKGVNPESCQLGKDFLEVKDGQCFGIPNDQIIYACRASKAECAKAENKDTIPFDVYFRMKDYTGTMPPEISSQCPKPGVANQKVVSVQKATGRKNLQLETFNVETQSEWLSAWCKPAIYLYPREKMKVHVIVEPKGLLNHTIPTYPKGGWNVTAYPDGRIVDQGKTYPYLYWEAALPDSLITEPETGYVVTHEELAQLFSTVLPQMGLNKKEEREFSEYWLKALPVSPYYFVGVVPESQINQLAPLTIEPKPDSMLRVSFYFKAIERKIDVKTPDISGFKRVGFTITEWGGFFKADKYHPDFTCLM